MTETTTTDTQAADAGSREVNPIPKASQTGRAPKAKAPARKATGAAKAPAKKPAKKAAKAPAKKAAGTGAVRAQSTVTKEGTRKCEFSGEVLPVTQFPTVRQSDGTYARGTVARKNLAAWRAKKKADREAKAKAAAAAKKASGTAKKAS